MAQYIGTIYTDPALLDAAIDAISDVDEAFVVPYAESGIPKFLLVKESYITHTATIANNTAVSDAVSIAGAHYIGLVMPATWTGANLTFQTSHDGVTYQNLYDDDGVEVTVQAAASRNIGIKTAALALAPWRYLKIRSGTSGTPVNQGGERTITAVLKG